MHPLKLEPASAHTIRLDIKQSEWLGWGNGLLITCATHANDLLSAFSIMNNTYFMPNYTSSG